MFYLPRICTSLYCYAEMLLYDIFNELKNVECSIIHRNSMPSYIRYYFENCKAIYCVGD